MRGPTRQASSGPRRLDAPTENRPSCGALAARCNPVGAGNCVVAGQAACRYSLMSPSHLVDLATGRCQRNSVSGVTSHPARLGRGSAAAIAPSKLRSASVSSGRSTCRRNTPSWWRNMMISRSFERRERTERRTSATNKRYMRRYTRTQHRPASRQVNDHVRVSGTHRDCAGSGVPCTAATQFLAPHAAVPQNTDCRLLTSNTSPGEEPHQQTQAPAPCAVHPTKPPTSSDLSGTQQPVAPTHQEPQPERGQAGPRGMHLAASPVFHSPAYSAEESPCR